MRALRKVGSLTEAGSLRRGSLGGDPSEKRNPPQKWGGSLREACLRRQGGPRTGGGPLAEAEAPEKPGAPEARDPPPAAPAPHSPKLLGASAGSCWAPSCLWRRGRVRSAWVPRRQLPQVAPAVAAAAAATGRRTDDRLTARAARGALGRQGCACARRGADPGREESPRRAWSHRSV